MFVVNSSTGCVLWYTLHANCDPLRSYDFVYVCVWMYVCIGELYQNIVSILSEYVYQCACVGGCVHVSVCMGEGVYLKQIGERKK